MTYEPPPDILDRATVALHDAHCPDRTCEPHTMGAYRTQARAVLVAVGHSIAATERKRVTSVLRAKFGVTNRAADWIDRVLYEPEEDR